MVTSPLDPFPTYMKVFVKQLYMVELISEITMIADKHKHPNLQI